MEAPKSATPPVDATPLFQEESEHIERLLEEIQGTVESSTWQQVEELVGRLSGLYGEGLARALCHVSDAGALDDGLQDRLCGDQLLASLLVLHGLHPLSTEARVSRALDEVRPTLGAHKGDVELLAIEDGAVRLRLLGSCRGCSSSTFTMENLLKRAIEEAAPEVTRVEVEGADGHPDDVERAEQAEPGLVQIGKLRKQGLALETTGPAVPEAERCELCAATVPPRHAHVVDLEERALLCACQACSLLFDRPQPARYRTVPDRVLVEPRLKLTTTRWAALGIPVQLAFVFYNSTLARWTAFYPSPAGPMEADVPAESLAALARESTLVRALTPDVEALLVRGHRGQADLECFLAPIDACYDLVARVRQRWRGFDGGDDARREIDELFEGLRARARPVAQDEGSLG